MSRPPNFSGRSGTRFRRFRPSRGNRKRTGGIVPLRPPDLDSEGFWRPFNKFEKFSGNLLTEASEYANICLALRETARNSTSASGGIGRLAGFRCQCSQGRAGSTPASRTTSEQSLLCSDVFYQNHPRSRETSGVFHACRMEYSAFCRIFKLNIRKLTPFALRAKMTWGKPRGRSK